METNKSAILISDEHLREVIEKITSILEKASDEIAAIMNGESKETREIVVGQCYPGRLSEAQTGNRI